MNVLARRHVPPLTRGSGAPRLRGRHRGRAPPRRPGVRSLRLAAVIGLARVLVAKVLPCMTKQLRIGMLGAGFIGSFHSYALSLQSLIRNPPCAAIWLAVLADLNEVVRTAVQKRFGWERTTSSWEEVVADRTIDVFVNAGPKVLHHGPVIEAPKAGKRRGLNSAI